MVCSADREPRWRPLLRVPKRRESCQGCRLYGERVHAICLSSGSKIPSPCVDISCLRTTLSKIRQAATDSRESQAARSTRLRGGKADRGVSVRCEKATVSTFGRGARTGESRHSGVGRKGYSFGRPTNRMGTATIAVWPFRTADYVSVARCHQGGVPSNARGYGTVRLRNCKAAFRLSVTRETT